MRPGVVAALLMLLTACAQLDHDTRDRQRLAWHHCTRQSAQAHAWITDCY